MGSSLSSLSTGSGIVLTDLGAYYAPTGYSIDIRPDGKIVITGQNHSQIGGTDSSFLVRYNADGTLDSKFSNDGRFIWDTSVDNSGQSVIALAGGYTLVAGFSGNDDNNNYNFALTRHNTDGSFDTSFGGGDGQVITNIGTDDKAYAIAVQSNDKIVLGGTSDGDFALVRYNANGTLDTSFGGDGIVTTDLGGENDRGRALAIQSDGKILLGGFSVDSSADFALVRYNNNGSLDKSFSGDGKLTTNMGGMDGGMAMTLQNDGRILLAGTSDGKFAIARYTKNGALDNSFGGDGKIFTDFSAGEDEGYSITLLANGKFLVGGSLGGTKGGFGLARYNADGSRDTAFGGGDGKVITKLPGFDSRAYDVSVQDDGKIVVCGTNVGEIGQYLAVIRYNANGTLDTSFGAGSGTQNADALNGTSGDDVMQGLAGNDTLNGLAGDDSLEGGSGNDLLAGGSGDDMLLGGNDADKFRFSTALNAASNVDTVRDFGRFENDIIELDNTIFAKLVATGDLSAANFRANATGTAADGNDYILYDTDSGRLYYDQDGSGAGARIQFALIGVSVHATLSAADFEVV